MDHQLECLRKSGLTNNKVVVVRGYESEQFTRTDIEYLNNDNYLDRHSLYSLSCAAEAMVNGFILIYSDILFDETLINRIIATPGDIILLLDNSYRHHQHEVQKKLELVVSSW